MSVVVVELEVRERDSERKEREKLCPREFVDGERDGTVEGKKLRESVKRERETEKTRVEAGRKSMGGWKAESMSE